MSGRTVADRSARRARFTGLCRGCGERRLITPSSGTIWAHASLGVGGGDCPGSGQPHVTGTAKPRGRS